ncbi:hypothetical protein DXM26_16805 [Agrobacterium tumefaciens]|uniref:CDP-glycerol glycerophosphotransferase family protein n=1 Tax=Agrobacterium tumefaciens TaxID=358 RepID=UPI00123008EA|nr:hypothetical protein DXM26_16805 [Agrobacterium tumefaciens]
MNKVLNETSSVFSSPNTDFFLAREGLNVLIAPDHASNVGLVVLEHTSSGSTWHAQKKYREVDGSECWLIPYSLLEKSGVYQLRYSSGIAGDGRVLGGRFARAIVTDREREIGEGYFQRSGELYRATLYIPYTRKSVRLRVELATIPKRAPKQVEHLTIKNISRKRNRFLLKGTAFVPGVSSASMKPFLVLRNLQGLEVGRFEGKRTRSLGNQKMYGFPDCDYSQSGFVFSLSVGHLARCMKLAPPARLRLSVVLVDALGKEYEKTLKSSPSAFGSKTRTIATKLFRLRKTRLSIISAEANDEIYVTHQIIEEVLSSANKFKRIVAFQTFNLLRRPSGKAWVLYEFEAKAAQDNAAALFEYLCEKRKDIDARFVIDRSSPDVRRLRGYGRRIVYRYTFRHYWSLLTARILISSQSRYHGYRIAPPKKDVIAAEMARKPFVFLQHGIIALKKIGFHRKNPRVACDLFFSSTKTEQEIICREFGYSREEVPIVGLPRFDLLQDQSSNHKELLVMPTWRKWLQSANYEEFKSSDFFIHYSSLLNSPLLEETCRKFGLKVNFYLHPMIARYISAFSGVPQHVELVVAGAVPLNELMMRARVLVTDYSSVAWDFMYMKKPVAFFHFDIPKYDEAHGSYFDLRTNLRGLSVATGDEVASLVQGWLEGEEWMAPSINELEHYDVENRERAVATIERFLLSKSDPN